MNKAGMNRPREASSAAALLDSSSWLSLSDCSTPTYRLLALALVVYCALAAFPPGPPAPNIDLDASWVTGLNLAHAQGLVAGKDWVFTFGPLGYLANPEPESGALALGLMYRVGISLVWCAILFVLAIRAPSPAMGLWLVTVFGLVAITDDFMYVDRLELTVAALALLPIWGPARFRYLELSLLALLAGFALMVKFNIGIEAVILLLVLTTYTVWNDRRDRNIIWRQALIVPIVLIVSSAGLYALSTGQIRNFGSYLHYTWEIAASYSESMGVAGPLWPLFLTALALALPFWALRQFGDSPRRYLPAVLPAATIAYFFFKHAFVRQDEMRFVSFLAQLAIAMLFVAALCRTRRDRGIVAGIQILFIVLSLHTSLTLDPNRLQLLGARFILQTFRIWAPTYVHLEQTAANLVKSGTVNTAHLRLDDRFHRIIGRGTVEAVPWEIAMVPANGWSWRPRPVFQSYQAGRPSLDRLNADHLASSRAADFIVLTWGDIDGRHPFLSDPLSWRAMLTWYDLALATPEALLLRRRATPRFGEPHETGHTIARWNEEIVIPQDQPLILMSVEVQRTPYGSIAGLLFRNGAVNAVVTYRSGVQQRWRAVAPNIAAGFPISALAQDLGGIAALWERQAMPDRAAAIHFEAEGAAEYTAPLKVRWLQVQPAR